MSRVILPTEIVGNEFLVSRAPSHVVTSSVAPPAPSVAVPAPAFKQRDFQVPESYLLKPSLWSRLSDFTANHHLIVIALLFLIVSSGATVTAGQIISARIAPVTPIYRRTVTQSVNGPNTVINTKDLAKRLAAITAQRIEIKIGSQTAALSAATTKSWLNVVTDKPHGVSYVHVNGTAVAASLTSLAKANTVAPVSEVKATQPDGTIATIATGKNGSQPADTSLIASQITKTFLSGRGMQLELPVKPVNFASVTPTAFAKLLEVNVNTKQMYAYDNGQLTRTFAISAGAPATPTPIGQYKVYQKLTVQDMKGLNPNGTKYFQPHVHWINYFLPGGYAVHGNYWRPLDWFGNINSSHGCVSLPDDEAEWVYNWAPIGTTVITHY